jgi:heme oxygenase (mycobilin-producing)
MTVTTSLPRFPDPGGVVIIPQWIQSRLERREACGLNDSLVTGCGQEWFLCNACRVYVSMSRLRVEPDRSDELIEAFRRRSGLVESHDGFIDLQVWRSDRDTGEVLMISRWRDRDAFKAYMQSSDHRISHARIDSSLKEAIALQRLEHLHTYEVLAE